MREQTPCAVPMHCKKFFLCRNISPFSGVISTGQIPTQSKLPVKEISPMRLLRRSLPLFCALILALILSLSLAACGERSKARPSSGTPETSSLPTQPPAEPAPPGGDCGLSPATRPDGGGAGRRSRRGHSSYALSKRDRQNHHSAPTTKHSHKPTSPSHTIPPAGNQIRRRHLVRPTGRRERAPPETSQGRWSLSPRRASRPTKH